MGKKAKPAAAIDEVPRLSTSDPRAAPLTAAHQPHAAVHESERGWEMLRYPGQWSKMLFHPTPEQPTVPNAGLVRYEPGASHPLHNHYFAQLWYILEGEFDIGGEHYGPGTMIFHPDPHYEKALATKTGGLILFAQYMGPTTRQAPIYDGRFNVKERLPVEKERADW
ncbi:MAG: cupin domain-containing protein [Alphaproteobacteria bacterium]